MYKRVCRDRLNQHLCTVKIETNRLMTVKNYATKEMVTAAYINKLMKEERMQPVMIDGVPFVDTVKYPTVPVISRR